MRIQVQQQAAHRRLHQRTVVDRIHVGLLDRVVDHHVATDLVQRHLGFIGLRGIRIVAGGDRVGFLFVLRQDLRHRGQRGDGERRGDQQGKGCCPHGVLRWVPGCFDPRIRHGFRDDARIMP